MLDELKFVASSVSKKGITPELQHFKIQDGKVQSYNGQIAMCSPIEFDINCVPLGAPFLKAINSCEETLSLSMTKANRLAVRSGPFKAFIPCLDLEEIGDVHVSPEGEFIEIDGESMLEGLKALSGFIGTDAYKPWTTGVLFKGNSMYATNNVIFAEYWTGFNWPRPVNVSRLAVKEVLRVKQTPVSVQLSENSVSFHYEDGKWIRSQLLDSDWPDPETLFKRVHDATPLPINPDLFTGLQVIKPFCDDFGRVYFTETGMSTTIVKDEGATYDIDWPCECAFQVDMLELLENRVATIDFSYYPNPCPFYKERLRGVIIGLLNG